MHVFKNTVNYYRHRGSHVFNCFINFNKASTTLTTGCCFVSSLNIIIQVLVNSSKSERIIYNVKSGLCSSGTRSPFPGVAIRSFQPRSAIAKIRVKFRINVTLMLRVRVGKITISVLLEKCQQI